jgi:hypothetical protein
MEKFLLHIKHRIPFVWNFIESVNGLLFSVLYGRKFSKESSAVLNEYDLPGFKTRLINKADLPDLCKMISAQDNCRLEYFKPHAFDQGSLLKVYRNPSFIMMGVFERDKIVGYFFLRCFLNRKCFVGRLIDQNYNGKGIGLLMNNIMYNIGWRSGFRVLSTISKNNRLVMKSHANNPLMVIQKELDNNYLLVEFVKDNS